MMTDRRNSHPSSTLLIGQTLEKSFGVMPMVISFLTKADSTMTTRDHSKVHEVGIDHSLEERDDNSVRNDTKT
ncbi:hypothetical protein QQG55_31425 [Brugia pahangi]